MDNRKDSDLIIQCEGREWVVPKSIIYSASEVLAKEGESSMQEGQSGTIKHDEFDADTVDRMVSYMYKQTYVVDGEDQYNVDQSEQSQETEVTADPPNINELLIAHVQVHAIADYYMIPKLENLAAERFGALTKYGLNFDGFVDMVKAIYEQTSQHDRPLRDRLCAYAMKRGVEIIKNKALMRALGDVEGFATDMIRQCMRYQILDKKGYEQRVERHSAMLERKGERVETLENTLGAQRARMSDYEAEIARLKAQIGR